MVCEALLPIVRAQLAYTVGSLAHYVLAVWRVKDISREISLTVSAPRGGAEKGRGQRGEGR